MSKKKLFILLAGVIVFLLGASAIAKRLSLLPSGSNSPSNLKVFSGTGYVAVDPSKYSVSTFAENITSPTRIKITPDGKYLLVTQVTGEVLAFTRTSNGWDKTPYKITSIETHFPGFPPEEGGLVGMVFSADYATNGKLFLLYSYRDQDKSVLNRISVTTLKTEAGKLVASPPEKIFEANVKGNVSHQITDGVGVKVNGTPQLLFLVGEGFQADRAPNPKIEGGKVLMISEDGGNPVGQRPYAEDPKVQAVGLRNGYVLTQNPYDLVTPPGSNRFLIADTGPDHYDRLIDLALYSPTGAKISPINLGWTGNEGNLSKPLLDANVTGVKNSVILLLPDTRTMTGVAFHPGKGAIPVSSKTKQSLLITLYGKTGSTENQPGKEILLGELTYKGKQPSLTTTPIVQRNPDAVSTVANPVGLEVDPQTKDFFFAYIFENKIYQVTIK